MKPDAAQTFLALGNKTEARFDRQKRVQDLVAAQSAQTANVVAVTGKDGALTYAELEARSDALAAHLQAQVPAQGQRIGVALPRDTGLLVGLLAVLKAGHAYVPLDPAQPLDRQRAVLQAAKVSGVIAPSEKSAALTRDLGCIAIDPAQAKPGAMPQPSQARGEDAAYIIFTSGSTGTPKGVEVPHRAVVNFLQSMAKAPGLTARDKLLSVTTVSFDIAVLELFLPLVVGAEVEIATREDILDGFRLVERASKGDITAVQATPTLWSMLLEAGFKPGMGMKLLAGGEPVPSDLAETLMQDGAQLWNMYGPTETTIWSSIAELKPSQSVTIGAPIDNTQMHVLDAADQLCVPGAVGELNIGGDGLANGYFGREDLTRAAFRDVDLHGQTTRLYKTGDLAIRNVDGSMTLLGRRDGQIKLRGFRIELGEIETHLRAQPGVAAAAVALRKGAAGTDQLVGYVVADDGSAPEGSALARSLSGVLPDYMVPTAWMTLQALPQTGNGKLDRKALPDPALASPSPAQVADAPSGETEAQIARIWQDVLGLDQLSVTTSLFHLGTDSLGIFRLAARLMEAGFDLEARDVFANPSVRALASHVEASAGKTKRPSLKDFARVRRTG